MTYTIVFKKSVHKDFRRIPHTIVRHIQNALRALAENPHPMGSIKLQSRGNFYRIRVGVYRVIYEVAEEIRIITIIRVGHRKGIYEQSIY